MIKAPSARVVNKSCYLCEYKISYLDYKDVALLRRFMSPHAKILGSKRTGTCRVHQRVVQTALKRARQMALLPFVPST